MDRTITQKEKRRVLFKLLIKISIITGVAVCALIIFIVLMRPSVDMGKITVSTVDTGPVEAAISANGQVASAYEEIINSPINTRIMKALAKVGDTLDVGTPLLKIDLQSTITDYIKMEDEDKMKVLQLQKFKTDTRSKLSEMKMRLGISKMSVNLKKKELDNERYLDSLGSGTADKVKQVELAYQTSLLELEQDEIKYQNEIANSDIDLQIKELELSNFRKTMLEAKRTLNEAELRSPSKAVLTFLLTEIGSQIAEGQKIAVISDLSTYKVTGEVPDSYASQIKIGARVLVGVGDQKLEGVLSEVVPLSKNGTITFTVRLAQENNKKLRSGLRCDIFIFVGFKKSATRIKFAPFYRGKGEYQLFVFEGNDLVCRNVVLGDSSNDYIEVLDGLSAGDRVVISDMNRWANNKKLRVIY